MMEGFIIALLLIINTVISWWNARVVGWSWIDVKVIGGWYKVVLYSAFIMSGCGFSWVYLVLVSFIGLAIGKLDVNTAQAILQLGYAVLIIPIIGSGIAIWIHSLAEAYRRKDAASIGVAGWNTFANAYNVYSAARTLPSMLKGLGSLFKSGGDIKVKAIMGVILCVVAGFLTTYVIVQKSASSYSHKVKAELESTAIHS